jgi:hypothetical protein
MGKPEGSDDAWYTGAMQRGADKPTEVSVQAVADARVQQAITMLERRAAMPLQPDQLEELAPGTTCDRTQTTPVLLRGLYLTRGTGGFSVTVSGGTINVFHGSLGRGPRHAAKRLPVVACLREIPERVCVSTSMAE